MGAASVIAPALAQLLEPLTVDVIDGTRTKGELEAGRAGFLQLIVDTIAPTEQQGQWLTTWEAWLCVPSKDAADADAELAELLPDVLAVLETVSWLTWTLATRDTHPENFAAWRLTLTTLT